MERDFGKRNSNGEWFNGSYRVTEPFQLTISISWHLLPAKFISLFGICNVSGLLYSHSKSPQQPFEAPFIRDNKMQV